VNVLVVPDLEIGKIGVGAKRVIDATGGVVAPGFVDPRSTNN
jgi:imidazolonepropionase-like amidohydrolase